MNNDLKRQHLLYYQHILKSWQPKFCGSFPTSEMILQAHALGCRPGKQALSIAMSLRKTGYTLPQYFIGSGASSTAHNKRNELVDKGLIEVKQEGSPTFYKAILTNKGKELIRHYLTKRVTA